MSEKRHKTRKRLLITGCGRSGTRYITHLLRRLGLEVGHERMRVDGIASWAMAVDADPVPWGVPSRHFAFDHVFHQVRDPRHVIASAMTFKPDSWAFVCAHTTIALDDPLPLRCAKYWYYWNLEAEKVAHWRYRIDAFPASFDEFCLRLGLTPNHEILDRLAPDVNTRKLGRAVHIYEELCERLRREPNPTVKRWLSAASRGMGYDFLSWDTLRSIDSDLAEKIRSKAAQYGYEV